VPNAEWDRGGYVQEAAGRILFEMPKPAQGRKPPTWVAYVCSGTVVIDPRLNASIILTAAHCVYDDVSKVFARNVIFIPNQAGSGTPTDSNCGNDVMGCWSPSLGVVDKNWTTRTFPNNVEWDYAYYVVPTTGAHEGAASPSDSLEDSVHELPLPFTAPQVDVLTHALGYSYSDDPNFMYCSEPLATASAVNWWLGSCELTGGSSGGPWIQPMDPDTGSGEIRSVNSWGYTNQPGMAGPFLDASADCTFKVAAGLTTGNFTSATGGLIATC
jgi:hypothetical protein